MYSDVKFLQLAFAYALRCILQKNKIPNPIIYACSPGKIPESKHASSATWSNWWWYKILRFLAYPLMKTMVRLLSRFF